MKIKCTSYDDSISIDFFPNSTPFFPSRARIRGPAVCSPVPKHRSGRLPDPLYDLRGDRDHSPDSDPEYLPDEDSLSSLPPSVFSYGTDDQEPQPGPSGVAQTVVTSPQQTEPDNSSLSEDSPEHRARDKVSGIKRGPSGANWIKRNDDYLPCACGSLIERRLVKRHVTQMCRLEPSPLARVQDHIKQVAGWSRLMSDTRVQCSKCLAEITSGEKTTITKAINTHLSKKH